MGSCGHATRVSLGAPRSRCRSRRVDTVLVPALWKNIQRTPRVHRVDTSMTRRRSMSCTYLGIWRYQLGSDDDLE